MTLLSEKYEENIARIGKRLRYRQSFDILAKKLTVGDSEVTFFYIDGFVKDGELQRVMQYLLSQKQLLSAEETEKVIPFKNSCILYMDISLNCAIFFPPTVTASASFFSLLP